MAYGCHEERYPLPITAVDTHRPNPKKAGAATAAFTPDKPKTDTARDYFGKEGTKGGGVHAGDVAEALEKGLESGEMTLTPKTTAKE
jgi:6-phosphofructo-2-kinase/fructose-2,6-biphosphatase 2